jgi:DNA-binding MarR family transcriptional regulator
VLSKQVALLEQAGLVEVTKKRVGRRVRTWLSLTNAGRATLAQHVAALQAIAAGAGAPTAQEAGA